MRTLEYSCDLCVVGGGIAGLCAALAAARHGISAVLIQDRPVLGGNASSEVRMHIGGAHGKDNRETGIMEELTLENFYRNPGLKYPLWDAVLYAAAVQQPNLKLLLNTSVLDAACDGNRIVSVTGWQSNAETFHTVRAAYFADCSGDSILAPLTGARYRYGREAKAEFGESIPPDAADQKTMGMSCLFQIRETDRPAPFVKPDWAYTYETDADLPYKDHELWSNFWWIEVGGEWDCIHDTDRCREECLKICYGVWDHMKNKGDHGAENWELEWIGFLPGKRESRRYIGMYTVTENDVRAEGRFDDLVAYAGWSMDDHFPEGFYYTAGHPTVYHPAPQPWGLPLRCMIAADIENLVFAGRNISVTHAALSSSRVMATCGVLGQALGTAVAQALREGKNIRQIDVAVLQDALMQDDCFLPWHDRKVPRMTLSAECNAPVCRNGKERGEENLWIGRQGEYIEYRLPQDTPISRIRLVFDSDLNRPYFNMPCRVQKEEPHFRLPETLIRAYRIEVESSAGELHSITVNDSHQRFVTHTVDFLAQTVRFVPLETWGSSDFRVFDFEIS